MAGKNKKKTVNPCGIFQCVPSLEYLLSEKIWMSFFYRFCCLECLESILSEKKKQNINKNTQHVLVVIVLVVMVLFVVLVVLVQVLDQVLDHVLDKVLDHVLVSVYIPIIDQ